MGEAFVITFGNMLMIIVMILIGYIIKKMDLVADLDKTLSKLTVYVFLPALNLHTFTTQCTPANFAKYANLIFYGGLFYLIEIIIAIILSRYIPHQNKYMKVVYQYCLAIPNTGGVGTPLVLSLFGLEGLFVYYLYLLPATIMTYGWATPQLMGGNEQNHGKFQFKNVINPTMIGCMIGMVLGLTGIGEAAPEVVITTINKMGSCYTPLALLVVGYIIAQYKMSDIIHVKIDVMIALLRLLIIPGAFLLVLKLLHAPFMLMAMVVLSFACPVGMNCVIYPTAYGEDSTIGAGVIVVTYLAAIVTVPLLYALVVL